MDGKRGSRATGTDGSDFKFRQTLDNRYEAMASAKDFINTAGIIVIGCSVGALMASVIEPSVYGFETPIVFRVMITLFAIFTSALGKHLTSKIVDQKLYGYLTMTGICSFMFALFAALCLGLGNASSTYPIVRYLMVVVHAFAALLSYRCIKAGTELLEASSSVSKRTVAVEKTKESTKRK